MARWTDDEGPEFTEADVKAWREGNWIFVKLGEEIVLRRMTRDRKLNQAIVIFMENRSPAWPMTRRYLDRVELRERRSARWRRGNRLYVDVESKVPDGERKRS